MASTFVLLKRVELTAAASSILIDSIPATGYTDLRIDGSFRSSGGGNVGSVVVNMAINGLTTNRDNRRLYGATTPGEDQGTGTGGAQSMTSVGTANTYSSVTWYIANYNTTDYKPYRIEGAAPNSSSTYWEHDSVAGLWSSSSTVSSLTFTPSDGTTFVAGTTISIYGISKQNQSPVTNAPKADGGSIIVNDGTYWIHTFLSSGVFTPQTALNCEYLVIAGGGGGSGDYSGGGAGGYRSSVVGETSGGGSSAESKLAVSAGYGYAVTVGAGGAGGSTSSPRYGYKGSDSTFSTITSTGGGAGSGNSSVSTNSPNGGSGGGGPINAGGSNSGGTGTTGQGYAGGSGTYGGAFPAGGGGGAGAVGGNGSGTTGGNGGNGLASNITGTSVTRAGGGGATAEGTATSGTGGTGGGGGAGASGGNNTGTAGTAYTGSGGGGGHYQTAYASGGAGGSGIVIIRYPMA